MAHAVATVEAAFHDALQAYLSRDKDLVDVAYLLAYCGYEAEAHQCAATCSALASDQRIMPASVVNMQHGRQLRTRLMYAAFKGNVPRLEWLLRCGARSDLRDSWARTAVWWAYAGRHHAAARLLAARRDFDPARHLYLCAWLGDADLVAAGIAQDVALCGSVEAFNAALALVEACADNHRDCALLLAAAPGIHANGSIFRALYMLADCGHAPAISLLLSLPGVDVNGVCHGCERALYTAARRGHTAVVARLLAAPGINVNAVGSDGCTPLQAADQWGHEECAALLRAATAAAAAAEGGSGSDRG